jgi:hypothetical protein
VIFVHWFSFLVYFKIHLCKYMYLDRNKCAGTLFPFNAGAFHFFVVAVLANAGLVLAIFCKYGLKNGPNLRFCCRTCGKCGLQSHCVQVRPEMRVAVGGWAFVVMRIVVVKIGSHVRT